MAVKIPKSDLWKAIAQNCKNCVYDKHESGTWREQVKQCKIIDCALYPYRPLPTKRSTEK